MTSVDWIIVGFTLLMALFGFRQGLIVSILSLAGFVAGAFAGAQLAPLLLEQGSRSPYAPLFALFGALVIGGATAAFAEAVGSELRARLSFRPLAVVDGAGGALVIAALGLGLVWITGAVALQTPGARRFRDDIQRSVVLRRLNDILPPSGPILNALARADPFPRIAGPPANVDPPTRGILADPEIRAARRSVVKVLGIACGLAVQGSGWVARPGIVVTNAHVVAGQDDTTVGVEGGPRLDAQAIRFDRTNDIAILRVSGLDAPALSVRSNARVGAPVAILGFPKNGPYHAEPGRLGPTETVISQDAYGAGPIERRMTALRGLVRSGNSGGPAVDGDGGVAATIFAAAESRPRRGFGVPPEIVERDLNEARRPVDTGPCAA
jgi:S1-C subfamily serine protease